MSNTRVA